MIAECPTLPLVVRPERNRGADETEEADNLAFPGTTAVPRIIYISYDGALDPLGQSQVVPYLRHLAAEFPVTLISFEKVDPTMSQRQAMESAGIRWRPLRYRRRPPLLSTAMDVLHGALVLRRELRDAGPALIHTRSYVSTEIVLRCPSARHVPLVFDIRGFWVDERLEGGLWRDGALARYARKRERHFYGRADAVVTLTHASTAAVERWLAERTVPVRVIPTCADVDRFASTEQRLDGAQLVWVGSIGTWYRFDLAVRIASVSDTPLRVLTGQQQQARAMAGTHADIGFVDHARLQEALHAGDVGLCLYRPGFSRLACAPTRFAEYLAAGMPVLVSPHIGDLDAIVEEEGVGLVLRAETDEGLRAAVATLLQMAADPAIRQRCRAVARRLFSVELGVRSYAQLYRDVVAADAS